MLWVSLYRIFSMGRLLNFLGMWVQQSFISLASGDFLPPSSSPCFALEPKLKQHQLLCSCTLLLTFPVHARLQPSCAGWPSPAPASLPRALSTPCSQPGVTCRAQCCCSGHPRCSQPLPWAADPPSPLGERPQLQIPVFRHFPAAILPLPPVPWPGWCPGECRGISGCSVSQFLVQTPKIPGDTRLGLLAPCRALPVLLLPFPLIPRP